MTIEAARQQPHEVKIPAHKRTPNKEHRSFGERILRAGEGRTLARIQRITDAVNSREEEYKNLSDDELRGKTQEFKDRLADGESLDALLPEAFAAVREASDRVLDMRQYDVQVMGGIALHMGSVAEMRTGEGKTLTATMPVYLNALEGKGAHVVTVNDYLARRDAEWMRPVYEFLGLSVGVLQPNRPSAEHRDAYNCDITYGTNNEFGFDYLRDNIAWSPDERVQRGHNFAIVDEADSILIDEARTPLIISEPGETNARWQTEFARLGERMVGRDVRKPLDPNKPKPDYEFDLAKRTVAPTEKGIAFVEDQLGTDNLYENVNTPLVGFLTNALKAKELYKKDKDYIVSDGEVLIVDEFTGRLLHGRRYNEGMHQAIEAKEHVEIQAENETMATTSLQNYFRLYKKLSGMTGTARSEESEFNKVYKMKVVTIPTHKPMIRTDHPDVVYKTEKEKFRAVLEEIEERHATGQPILVGTISIENSEYLASMLRRKGIPHTVLNAKYLAKEAEIVAQAGRLGAVTIATNMAGRGTDILLGGNPAFMAEQELATRGIVKESDLPVYQSLYDEAYAEAFQRYKQQTDAEAEEVVARGGLYILGTERHESRRIDNQLRGRGGRQGDPGESRFFLSLEDDLMRRTGGAQAKAVLDRFNLLPDDVPIESKMVTRQIRNAQAQIEAQNAEIRKDVLKYDEVPREQRAAIYKDRNLILESDDLTGYVHNIIRDVVSDYVTAATAAGFPEDWDTDRLWSALRQTHEPGFSFDQLALAAGGRDRITADSLRTTLTLDFIKAYDARAAYVDETMGEGAMTAVERDILLKVLDRKWREHLYEMDYLREGVGLRAYAQRNPLVEYQHEGFSMFNDMKDALKEEAAQFLFNAPPRLNPPTEPETAPNPEPESPTIP